VKNYGSSQTAVGVRVVLRSDDGAASVTDSVRDYGDLGPGQVGAATPFGVVLSAACTSGQRVRFVGRVTAGDSIWTSAFELTVGGPTLAVRRYTVHDGNGVLDPGESAELSVLVHNRGSVAASGLTAVLRSANPQAVAILDSSGSFPAIAPGDSGSNAADRFGVRAAPGIGVGRRFTLRLVLSGGDGFSFSHDLTVTVGQPAASTPLGPDWHGYYAYDNTDAGYAERPEYAWVEIDPAQGGQGTRVEIGNDRAVPVSLPFAFTYYGGNYNTVSVCDNGYMALGTAWLGDPYNWCIPSASGPDGIVAPFWDDFRTDTLTASGVYTWYDAVSHRFVVEWSRCRHVHGFRNPVVAEEQTFEAMLCDPQYYGTVTGDGPIVFQYHTVQNDDSVTNNCHNYATAGVQRPDHLDGVEYTFAGAYPDAAAPLAAGRAIRFTTNPPDTFTAVAEPHAGTAGAARFGAGAAFVRGSVAFVLAAAEPLWLRVFDAVGREVNALAVPAGRTRLEWNLTDRAGRRAPAGVYCAVLTPASGRTSICDRCRFLVVE
jgi:hypothetical protein